MMNFTETVKGYFEATNSLKPVNIHRRYNGQFMLYMPEGDLHDNFTSAGPFVSFDAAKRYAEVNVGFTWKELADALGSA